MFLKYLPKWWNFTKSGHTGYPEKLVNSFPQRLRKISYEQSGELKGINVSRFRTKYQHSFF